MKRRVIDVSALPPIGFGHRDPLWWAVILLVAIEATILAFLAIAYYYVRARTSPWPPVLTEQPVAWLGAVELALLLASVVPMHHASRAAERGSVRGMQVGLIAATTLGAAALVVRVVVFDQLGFRWDANAYASVVWTLLGLHTIHLIAGVAENVLFVVFLLRGPIEQKHRVDINVSTPLWYFVVAGQLVLVGVVHADIFATGRM